MKELIQAKISEINKQINDNMNVLLPYKDAVISVDSHIAELIQSTALLFIMRKRLEDLLSKC